MTPVAELKAVSFHYPHGGGSALRDLTLSIAPGEAVYCAGLSGGGKSTLIRLLNGLAWQHYGGRTTGSIAVQGADHSKKSLNNIARDVGTLFQNPDHQFFALSPRDDFLLTMECRGLSAPEAHKRLAFWSEKFNLGRILDRRLETLSSGEKQKVILAEMLALSPSLLLLDEPSANLDPGAAADLAEHLRQARRDGVAMLIVDHRRNWLDDWVDRAIILDQGRLVWEGAFERLDDPELQGKWGLRRHRDPADKPPAGPAGRGPADDSKGVLAAKGVTFAYKKGPGLFKDFSLALPGGAVTALVGANGSGKTTMMRLLSGLLEPQSGEIIYENKPLKASKRLRLSSLAMQNADRQLVMRSVRAELAEARPAEFSNDRAVLAELEFWGLAHLGGRHPQSLSGGEKQRLVLACAAAREGRFLALDEPTSGLDGRNMSLVGRAIKKAAAASKAVLLVTHDQELIDQAADRIMRLA
jgi:energy-coupling factor transport system ATP-binding protein